MGQKQKMVAVLVLVGYVATVLALTVFKTLYRIGYLWRPHNQYNRSLELIPFEQLWASPTWFGPIFDCLGNFLMFIPLGVLLARITSWSLKRIVLVGATLSLGIEVTQFIAAVGRTDTDDLILNSLGTWCGAWWLRRRCGERGARIMVGVVGMAVVSFVAMVLLTPILYPEHAAPWNSPGGAAFEP